MIKVQINDHNTFIRKPQRHGKITSNGSFTFTLDSRFRLNNFFGLIGFVLSIFSLFLFWLPPISIIASLSGLALSIVALALKSKFPKLKGFAIAGLVLSIITFIMALALFDVYIYGDESYYIVSLLNI